MRLGIDIAIAMLWLATGASLSTRTYFVFNYAAVANLPPHLEILAVPLPVLSILILVIVTLLAIRYSQPLAQSSKSTTQSLLPWDWFARVCLVFASLPLILLITRTPTVATSDTGISNPFGASFWWEPILFAGFTGIATYSIFRSNVHLEATGKTSQQKQSSLRTDFDLSQHDGRQPILSSHQTSFLVLCIATLACSGWWYWQSIRMFSEFQLGFNDFGHFLLRVIRTTRGQGLLIESPVLPAFWDHFNPGLLLLVPLWSLWPQAELVFALQAISLAGSAILIYGIAKRRGHSPIGSLCWGLGWLAYPSIGQMNLAYTYGWHPITLAIPCLLLAYYLFILGRWPLAIAAALLASSFEEGAVAAIGAFAFARAAQSLWENRCKINASASASVSDTTSTRDRLLDRETKGWFAVGIISVIAFAMIYRFSGIASFQTGRFAKLGATPFEIILSPILRTQTLFGLLTRERNLAFMAFLFAPFAVTLCKRSFLWTLLACGPLLAVLLLWEHMPAQSLAFQYASVLLPILFIGAMEACTNYKDIKHKEINNKDTKYQIETSSSELPVGTWNQAKLGWTAAGAATSLFITGFLLSIYVGQFPWSNDTLIDVKTRAYAMQGDATRAIGTSENALFHRVVTSIRSEGIQSSELTIPFRDCRILATGRLASHFLGAKDLETVGQYWQRANDYQRLDPSLASPLLRYDLIVIDPYEAFQQTTEESVRVLREATSLGFQATSHEGQLVVLTRTK